MEKIDRELLIKEVSGRLPYGIKAQIFGWDEEKGEEVVIPLKVYSINTDGYISFEYNHYSVETVYVDECRLYLRPMSSMTEEEWKEFDWFVKQEPDELFRFRNALKFYNKNHIDYNGLIPMGLALEAPEGMYV